MVVCWRRFGQVKPHEHTQVHVHLAVVGLEVGNAHANCRGGARPRKDGCTHLLPKYLR